MTEETWLLNIAGGAALLLWGVRMVRTGVMGGWGGELRRLMSRAGRDRLAAFSMGLGAAGVVQSSAAVALLAVAFASKGLLATAPGLAVLLGADLGSTLVVQLLSFDVSWLSPGLILAGVVCHTAGWSRHLGRVSIGLGLILLSLTLITAVSEPLRQGTALGGLLTALAGEPALALLLGASIAWVAHSSVAVVLLVMSLVMAGVAPVTLGLSLVLGANIGSGLVPVGLTWAGAPAARRLPVGNLGFRIIGAVAVLPLVGAIEPLLPTLGEDPGRQIANFHTLFNLALVVVFLPLTGLAARMVERVLPDRAAGDEGPFGPRYLDPAAIARPAVALGCAMREVMRMADIVETMLGRVMDVFRDDDAALLERLSALDDEVDGLHESIKLYLTRVSRNELSDRDSRRCVELITFTTNLEHIGDIIDKNLLELARKKIRHGLRFSDQGWRELVGLHARTLEQMQMAMSLFVSGDGETARRMIEEKEQFRTLEREGGERHLERLRGGHTDSIETSGLHLDILRDLKRVNSHLTSVAYPILDAAGELRPSRLKSRPETARGEAAGT